MNKLIDNGIDLDFMQLLKNKTHLTIHPSTFEQVELCNELLEISKKYKIEIITPSITNEDKRVYCNGNLIR